MIEEIISEMKKNFGQDQKRINHALKVLEYANKIIQTEIADKEIVQACAVLHDIGILEAEKKYGSPAGHYQEIESPPIAKKILEKIFFPQEKISQVCSIIANHHSPGKIESVNFQVLYEADNLVNLQDDFINWSKEKKQKFINRFYKTKVGIQLANSLI